MHKKVALIILVLIALISVSTGSPAPARQLSIYFIDVEGGASTLIVTPAGESVLIDAGWAGFDSRDAKRIKAAMDAAHVTAIDHMIATHYHGDHFGGIPEIARLVTIKHFYDHGKIDPPENDKALQTLYAAYQATTKGQSTTLQPGDVIALKQAPGDKPIKLLCLVSSQKAIAAKSTIANPECASKTSQPVDTSDNANSLGFLLSYGDFRFLDNGDLTWNIEEKLVCPVNNIGHVDLYQAAHHGANNSNNSVLLHSVNPTVSVIDNGPRKGADPEAIVWLKELPSTKALYQLHRNAKLKPEQNTTDDLIANLDETPDAGNMISVSVDPTKHVFAMTNQRTNATRNFEFK